MGENRNSALGGDGLKEQFEEKGDDYSKYQYSIGFLTHFLF